MAFLATFLQCLVLGLVIIANSEVRELLDKAPRLSIRIVIWILPSDTETSATTPCERLQNL